MRLFPWEWNKIEKWNIVKKKSPRDPGAHLIDLGKMKGLVTQWTEREAESPLSPPPRSLTRVQIGGLICDFIFWWICWFIIFVCHCIIYCHQNLIYFVLEVLFDTWNFQLFITTKVDKMSQFGGFNDWCIIALLVTILQS